MNTLLKQAFASLGLDIIHFPNNKQINGVDLWVQRKGGRPLSVEIKQARKQRNGCVQVDPVCPDRRKDDLVAIILSSQYVLIEPLKDHLLACSPKGTRQLTLLLGSNP
jgi:hypothetical protein